MHADEDGLLLGVISGYDLLALESTPGRIDDSVGFFPPVDRCRRHEVTFGRSSTCGGAPKLSATLGPGAHARHHA